MVDVQDAIKATNENIYFAAPTGLFEVTASATTPQQINALNCHALFEFNNEIWLGATGDILKFDGQLWTSLGALPGLPTNNYVVQQIAATTNGVLWFLIDSTVYQFDGNSFYNENKTGTSLATIGNTLYLSTADFSEPGFQNSGSGWVAMPALTSQSGSNRNRSLGFVVQDGTLYNDAQFEIYHFLNNEWMLSLPLQNPFSVNRMAATQSGVYVPSFQSTLYKITLATIDTLYFDYEQNNFNLFKGSRDRILAFTAHRDIALEVIPEMTAHANQFQTITPNSFAATFTARGEVASLNADNYGVTLENRTPAIFHQNVWLSTENNIMSAGSKSGIGKDYYSGPVASSYDSAYIYRYNHVWKVTAAEIEYHKQNYTKFSYTAPHGIAKWPGNGLVNNGEAQILAPFIDLNFNGIYEPNLGEYPEIRGTEMLYTIFNTHRGPNAFSETTTNPIEIHQMVYGFDTVNVPETDKGLFISWKIYNRGTTAYLDTRFGLLTDFHIGDPTDDLFGSDSVHELYYAYNYDLQDNSPFGIGTHPPALVGAFLDLNLIGFSGFHSLSGSMGQPGSTQEMHLPLTFAWRDGTPFRIDNPSGPLSPSNGNGYVLNGAAPPTQWLYNEAVNWYQGVPSMANFLAMPVVSMGDIYPEESFCLNHVLAYGRDTLNPTNDTLASLAQAKANIGVLKQFFNTLNYDQCLGATVSTSEEHLKLHREISLFPNPVKGGNTLTMNTAIKVMQVELFSMLGSVTTCAFSSEAKTTRIMLPSSLSVGLYTVCITTADGATFMSKVMVQ